MSGDPNVPPPLPAAVPEKQPKGCLFYGCITAVVLAIVAGIGGYFAVRYAFDTLVEVLVPNTEPAPMPMPESALPEREYAELEQRVNAFGQALDATQAAPPLSLSAEEINALIDRHPAWDLLRGHVHVAIEGDRLLGDLSIPIGDLLGQVPGLGELRGRFLNGSAEVEVRCVGDVLVVALQSLTVRGKPVDGRIMRELRKENLAEMHGWTGRAARMRNNLANVRVEGGRLVIEARAGR
ncbi:MAG: hypothetical protein FJ265_18170 [Planctomycetes bacterium]|nr:hypothetical protein [Planctomycetota bacterium]